jgi:hypothetical protein
LLAKRLSKFIDEKNLKQEIKKNKILEKSSNENISRLFDYQSIFALLKGFKETNYFWALMLAMTINQVSSAVRAVYFVIFDCFFVTYAAFF